jgi:hypothetical protein
MATTEKNSVIVELYDLVLTDRKDDRFGRVVTPKSLTEDDLISIAVARRTDLNAATLRASMDILKEVAIEQIANANRVCFGLGYFGLDVHGIFIGDHAKWDPKINKLNVHVTPVAKLREAVNSATVHVLGMASIGAVINSVTDVSTGEVNTTLTPAGGANLVGNKIKIAGDHPENGISLIMQETQEVTMIPMNSLLINEPSRISFIIPADLRPGDYLLKLTTQFSSATQTLKEPRSFTLDYILRV